SAHVTEETVGAEKRAPWGILMSIVVSAVVGYILLIGLTIAIPDTDPTTRASDLATMGSLGIGAVPYILTTGLSSRFGGDGRLCDLRPDPRRSVLLRHVVGDRQLAHDLRLLPRRRHPRLAHLAYAQQAAHPCQRRLAGVRRRVRAGHPCAVQHRRVLRHRLGL